MNLDCVIVISTKTEMELIVTQLKLSLTRDTIRFL